LPSVIAHIAVMLTRWISSGVVTWTLPAATSLLLCLF